MTRLLICVLLAVFLMPLLGGGAVGPTELQLAAAGGAVTGLVWHVTARRTRIDAR